MLLFKERHKAAILAGTKVETRRLSPRWRANVGTVHLAKTQMLSTEYFAKLHITARREERLGDITDQGARDEGYESRAAYLAAFAEINAKKLKKSTVPLEDLMVKVIRFEVI